MNLRSCTLLLFCLFYWGKELKAQEPEANQIETAKVDMLRLTAEFLTNDTKTFPKVKPAECKACNDKKALIEFSKKNQLKGFDKIIDKKIDVSIGTSRNSLEDFKDALINKIIQRTHRKELEAYNEYKKRMDNVVSQFEVHSETNSTPTENNNSSLDPSTDSLLANADEVVKTSEAEVGDSVQGSYINSSLTYGAAILALVLIIVLFIKNKNKNKTEELNTNKHNLANIRNSYENEKTKVSKLESEKQELIEKNFRLEEELSAYKRKEIEFLASLNKQEEPSVPAPLLVDSENLWPQTMYATYADLGDGFSNLELLDKPNNETIFEILITNENKARYRITDSSESQQYALSNSSYFLGKTCVSDNFPSANSTIVTEEEGILTLHGNKWQILQPAKIKFI